MFRVVMRNTAAIDASGVHYICQRRPFEFEVRTTAKSSNINMALADIRVVLVVGTDGGSEYEVVKGASRATCWVRDADSAEAKSGGGGGGVASDGGGDGGGGRTNVAPTTFVSTTRSVNSCAVTIRANALSSHYDADNKNKDSRFRLYVEIAYDDTDGGGERPMQHRVAKLYTDPFRVVSKMTSRVIERCTKRSRDVSPHDALAPLNASASSAAATTAAASAAASSAPTDRTESEDDEDGDIDATGAHEATVLRRASEPMAKRARTGPCTTSFSEQESDACGGGGGGGDSDAQCSTSLRLQRRAPTPVPQPTAEAELFAGLTQVVQAYTRLRPEQRCETVVRVVKMLTQNVIKGDLDSEAMHAMGVTPGRTCATIAAAAAACYTVFSSVPGLHAYADDEILTVAGGGKGDAKRRSGGGGRGGGGGSACSPDESLLSCDDVRLAATIDTNIQSAWDSDVEDGM